MPPPKNTRRYWLMKSEPSVFSIQALEQRPDKTSPWDGVRNYMARNYMREMKTGDGVLFYHSSEDPVGIAGTAEVAREAYPDHTAWDPASDYHDPRATSENQRWSMVDVRWTSTFPRLIPLEELRKIRGLKGMILLRRGNRLSVTPVTAGQWSTVLKLGAR